MKSKLDHRLDQAIEAVRADLPSQDQVEDSMRSAASRLGLETQEVCVATPLWDCKEVQKLLPTHRKHGLPEDYASLVNAHLRECGACLLVYRQGAGGAAVDWSLPQIVRPAAVPRTAAWRWSLAFSCALLVGLFLVYRAYFAVPPGVRAEVTSIDGTAYLVGEQSEQQIRPGMQLRENDRLRTGGSSRAVLRLSDGSMVEVNQRTALQVGARGKNMTVALDAGAMIVNAAHRTAGHLYVRTPDCKVAVQGTVFSVNSGLKGSRVAVLEGTVRVAHAGITSVLRPGEQVATSASLAAAPVAEQIAWSGDRVRYLELLAQFSTLQQKIGQIPFPQPRYTSDLLDRVPTDAALYVSIPNLGEFLSQANGIFRDQLKQSPVLQEWWSHGHEHNTAQLDEMVEKLHSVSEYLGDEVVVAARSQSDGPDFAIVADVARSGLADLLRQQFSSSDHGLVVLTPATLAGASGAAGKGHGYALVRDHEVVFAPDVQVLREWNARLDAGQSGFAGTDFGKQIAAAYGRGAGIILAADLHQVLAHAEAVHKMPREVAARKSGIETVRYLIAEHREQNNTQENHLSLSFAGERQRVASWLGAPAPMSSLGFVSPNAALTVAVLSKDPRKIADDILSMADNSRTGGENSVDRAQQELQINLRDDLAATMGGEFLLALDGPALPSPSWKAVIEVNDPTHLESTLERIANFSRQQSRDGHGRGFSIQAEDVSGQRFYTVSDAASGAALFQYTFSRAYMVAGPNRAILMDALQTQASGNSLDRSASFRALLPKDANDNYSAVAYQNLGPVLTPVLSQLSGDAAEAISKLAADARPTAICAWGKEDRIEVASDSRLFGFDFLSLGALLHPGNKAAHPNVLH